MSGGPVVGGGGGGLEHLGLGEVAADAQRLQQAPVPEGCSRLRGSAPQGWVPWPGTIPGHVRGCDPEGPEEVAVLWIWSSWDCLVEAVLVSLVGTE